jgi:hypothetical protein
MNDDQLTGFDDAEGAGRTNNEVMPKPHDAGAGHHPLPAHQEVVDLGDDAGAGTEDMRMEEQLTPFLRILQAQSPQVLEGEGEYVDGARAGMFFDTATQEVFPGAEGLQVMVAARDYHYGMWLPRDSGGGFRGMLMPEDPNVRRLIAQHGRFRKLPHVTPDGEAVDLVETIQLYLLYAPVLAPETARRAIMSFSSASLPVAQNLLTRHNGWRYRQPDGAMRPAQLWSYVWRVKTVPQQNAKGRWYNYRFDLEPSGAKPMGALVKRTDPLFAMGREFYQLVKSGGAKPDYTEAAKAEVEAPF